MKKKKNTNNTALSALSTYKNNYIWRRIFATILDFFVITLICTLAENLLGEPNWSLYVSTGQAVEGLTATDPLVLTRMALYQRNFLITLLIGAAYESLFMVCFNATLGKLFFSLRIVDLNQDRNILLSKLMLIVRALSKSFTIYLLSAIPYIFCCLSVFGNNKGQSAFDMLVRTRVIDIKDKENQTQKATEQDLDDNMVDEV